MDSAEATVFANSLLAGGPVAGWELIERISHGKSAVVIRGRRGQANAAVKIFHPGLIEQYGRDAQVIRVSRERDLIEKSHPNIVRILDAGACEATGHLFVAMEVAAGQPLSKLLALIPRTNIYILIEQLARAARQLENWGLTHRDIKPDNIHVANDLSSLTLLDFGVLKPHGDDSATSLQASKAFIGTHQYSPPEMIHGREEDTLDGWKAITFYQIGAVLHDLIARAAIFSYATHRHADLVAAIDNDKVTVTADDVDPHLCNLATRCLVKLPKDRLELVRWEDFMFSERAAHKPSLESRRAELKRRLRLGTVLGRVDPLDNAEARRLKDQGFWQMVQSARVQFDQALLELDSMPVRSTMLEGGVHPLPALTYTFAAAPAQGFTEPFRIQIAIARHEDGSLIDVYSRASKGTAETEVGWTCLGPSMESLDGFSENFQEWMLSIIEELIK
ncbi:protein kinase domain-containing protein [Burkholderia multivorans]|uniref:protein kinase domain-containing protein n=1 Tax=Burkholderia multivorans TaxID=87883 RepID=UPI001C2325B8|nr:protein kinase [Burkholderia multivorans]MBU9558861.1 protein kinase [Burkholderia multivorans]